MFNSFIDYRNTASTAHNVRDGNSINGESGFVVAPASNVEVSALVNDSRLENDGRVDSTRRKFGNEISVHDTY